jgi:hypothetical protein
VKGQSKPLNIRYHFYANYTVLDLWTYIISLLKLLENKEKRATFVFPLALAKYYPLLVKLSGKGDTNSNLGSDSKEEQDNRSQRGRQLGIQHKKGRKRSKTPKTPVYMRLINIANLDPLNNAS